MILFSKDLSRTQGGSDKISVEGCVVALDDHLQLIPGLGPQEIVKLEGLLRGYHTNCLSFNSSMKTQFKGR